MPTNNVLTNDISNYEKQRIQSFLDSLSDDELFSLYSQYTGTNTTSLNRSQLISELSNFFLSAGFRIQLIQTSSINPQQVSGYSSKTISSIDPKIGITSITPLNTSTITRKYNNSTNRTSSSSKMLNQIQSPFPNILDIPFTTFTSSTTSPKSPKRSRAYPPQNIENLRRNTPNIYNESQPKTSPQFNIKPITRPISTSSSPSMSPSRSPSSSLSSF